MNKTIKSFLQDITLNETWLIVLMCSASFCLQHVAMMPHAAKSTLWKEAFLLPALLLVQLRSRAWHGGCPPSHTLFLCGHSHHE